jgi:hypothetical protein
MKSLSGLNSDRKMMKILNIPFLSGREGIITAKFEEK